ncbi:anti-sigma-F factor Fin [Tumebacillus lipolyticus]|uniref:Anti-sigma-F factor Fin n=1 Tax=Tumebacillus lipolyticus TaxID=1280370 RepID=A0ABW4ZY39_9BACL
MRIIYYCRHCQSHLGEVDGKFADEVKLGFRTLTPEEAADIITYNSIQDSTYVKTICEYCQEAIEAHPELSLLSNPLQ